MDSNDPAMDSNDPAMDSNDPVMDSNGLTTANGWDLPWCL